MTRILIFLFLIIGCKTSTLKPDLIKIINSNRIETIRGHVTSDQKEGYKPLSNNSKKILTTLFTELLNQHKINLKLVSSFNILDAYSFGAGQYSGAVWNNDFLYAYSYNFEQKTINLKKYNNDFSNYSRSANLNKDLLMYLNKFSIPQQQLNLPITGRTNQSFCIFSQVKRINSNQYNVESIAFKEQ